MKLTFRIWLLLVVVFLSLLSIFVTFDPFGLTFLQDGVIVSSVTPDSQIADAGLIQGMRIISINGEMVTDLDSYQRSIDSYSRLPEGTTSRLSLGVYNSEEIVGLFDSSIATDIKVSDFPLTKLTTGLDLQGGARAFLKVREPISPNDADDLIAVLEQRLNVYGLSDLSIYQVTGSDGQPLIGVEIAGSTPDELEKLVGEQGQFVARIGNETVFVGGDKDVSYVGRSGTEALITDCSTTADGDVCSFAFTIHLSPEAANRHAAITNTLGTVDNCLVYDPNCYLDQQLDFYIDDELSSSLNIGASLKGNAATSIQISGSELGASRDEAIANAEDEMKRLQTILITGSLPYDIDIVKIDRISANLGDEFIRQILISGLFAILAIIIFTFVRYRTIGISVSIILVSLSEVVIILGVAALINWNLNLVSIAGIIAAIGTGIDSQIIILDESRYDSGSLPDRIKKALFIITTAFATTLVALLPLTGMLGFLGIGAASAGLLKGFAITTLIGITVGVVITRPAFADIAKQLK